MQADFTKSFNKQFAKLPHQRQQAAKTAIGLFLQNPTNPSLRLHPLKGTWQGYVSISAGGDLRLHLQIVSPTKALFVAIGSHSQLYK